MIELRRAFIPISAPHDAMKLPIPIALAAERSALARLYIDLSLAFRSIIPNHKPTGEPDAPYELYKDSL